MIEKTIPKNHIIKKYNLMCTYMHEIQGKMALRKDITAKRAFRAQAFYKTRVSIIKDLLNKIFDTIENDIDMWYEAVELAKNPVDINGRILDNKSFDLVSEINNISAYHGMQDEVSNYIHTEKEQEVSENVQEG